jgi:hypothetical protein
MGDSVQHVLHDLSERRVPDRGRRGYLVDDSPPEFSSDDRASRPLVAFHVNTLLPNSVQHGSKENPLLLRTSETSFPLQNDEAVYACAA